MTTGAQLPASRPPRVWFVDVVRLLASLQMVNGHTLDAVMLPALKQGPFFDTYNWGRGLVSVGFLMVAGIAFHVSTLARFERHRANPVAIRARFRRALVVIAAVGVQRELEHQPLAGTLDRQQLQVVHRIG